MMVGPRRAPPSSALISSSIRSAIRVARSTKSALGEPQWPMGEGDLEEVEGDAPIGIVSVGRERLDLGPWRALDDHVVDQRRKVAGERVGLRRRRRDQRGLGGIDDEPSVAVDRADRAAQSLAPGARHGCEHMAAGQASDGARQGGARRSLVALGGEGGRRLVRLEGAERRDTRQDKAALAARHEQRLGQGFGGALRRHVDCGVGQRDCSAGAGEAVDEGTVEKVLAQSRQERRAGGNREDLGLANGHGRLLGGRRRRQAASFRDQPLSGTRPASVAASRRQALSLPESRTAANPGRLQRAARECPPRAAARIRRARRFSRRGGIGASHRRCESPPVP